jgi:DNA polymerase-3 subunit epsilon
VLSLESLPSLRDLPVLAMDCQSTGATPAHGSLLEVGWALSAAGRDAEPESMLVALPEGASIPKHVGRITGIDLAMLHGARAPGEVWMEIARATRSARIAVIHFASFERRFLEALHAEHGDGAFPLELVCTHEIAQRLFRDLPRRGLRPLAGYFGDPAGELRRAADHVRATQRVWRHLVRALEAHGVHTIDELRTFVRSTPSARSAHPGDVRARSASRGAKPPKKKRARPLARGFPMPKELRAALPDAPGVYRMRRVDGSLLYVGKATSLKRRVDQHFTRRRGMPDRALEMLTQARALDVTPTETALEAALLEHDEIKTHDPPYNVALKRDPTRIAFASFDLRSLAPAPDDQHPLGPIRDPRRLEGIVALVDALAGREVDPVLALGVPVEPARELFIAAIASFVQRHALHAPSLREVLALGARIEIEEREHEEDGWTVERVEERIAKRIAAAQRALARARFLCLLSESTVSFVDGGARRLLVISRGEIAGRAWQPLDAVPPLPPGYQRRASERRRMDLAGYDRLRVLTTELRAVEDPQVRCGPSALLSGPMLARVLGRV